MEETGIIVAAKEKNAVVMVEKKGQRNSCGSCSLCKRGKDGNLFLEARNNIGAKKGDRVKIEIDETAVLKGLFFIYGVPLAGFVAAAALTRLTAVLHIKVIIFSAVCISAWLYGLAKGNAEGIKNKAKLVSKL